jgi:hypothetical protein
MVCLIINAVEAMSHCRRSYELLLRTVKTRSGSVLVAVCNSGPGVNPEKPERIFHACFATKPDGLGMDLSICRAIIQAPRGQLSATRARPGAPSCSSPYRRARTAHRALAPVGTSRDCATNREIAAVHESVVDAADDSSTATRVPWIWTLFGLRFRGARHADGHDSRFRYRQISLPGSRN